MSLNVSLDLRMRLISMKQCNCEHTYQTKWLGEIVCVICGEPWPDDVEDTEEKLSANHLKLDKNQLDNLENLL